MSEIEEKAKALRAPLKVRAKSRGYYGHQIKEDGQVFHIEAYQFSPRWMSAVNHAGIELKDQPKKSNSKEVKAVFEEMKKIEDKARRVKEAEAREALRRKEAEQRKHDEEVLRAQAEEDARLLAEQEEADAALLAGAEGSEKIEGNEPVQPVGGIGSHL